ncbi:hypothetical protein RVR_2460 [Actinacidiphila reveromycinica]|uniref:Uncharacterized protein n=1 Tax=Actinacidiphila reveromycinica TaxID=659352 RepID=A0A7U3VMV2_9ACTN|nr:hypothetical protein RVR_2460 [Streptomyces sp. SN-593]
MDQVERAIVQWVGWYDERLHSVLNHLPPVEFETRHNRSQSATNAARNRAIRQLRNSGLTLTQRTVNPALAAARAPVERGMAQLKSRQINRRSRISTNRMSVIATAVLTLERQR